MVETKNNRATVKCFEALEMAIEKEDGRRIQILSSSVHQAITTNVSPDTDVSNLDLEEFIDNASLSSRNVRLMLGMQQIGGIRTLEMLGMTKHSRLVDITQQFINERERHDF